MMNILETINWTNYTQNVILKKREEFIKEQEIFKQK